MTASSRSTLWAIRRNHLLLVVAWTIAMGCAGLWASHQLRRHAEDQARLGAAISFEKDVLYRRWATLHGGVYVPATERTPPNPYLADIPERDLTTPSGRKLTLINPAYMTRQVHELAQQEHGVRGHITSLNPIRPGNAPDAWETAALRAFEAGVKEVATVETLDGVLVLRLMRPFRTEAGCLSCHAAQGYKEGDIRGGISVAVPLRDYYAAAAAQTRRAFAMYAGIWALGFVGLVLMQRGITRHVGQREQAETALRDRQAKLDSIVRAAPAGIGVVVDRVLTEVNQAVCAMTGYGADELVGHSVRLLYPTEEEFARVGTDKYRQIAAAGSGSVETRWRCKDGRILDVLLSSSPIVPGDLAAGVTFTALDVTERQAAARALAARTQQLEAVRAIAAEITRELDLAVLLRLIAERAGDLLRAGAGGVYLWDPKTQTLTAQGKRDDLPAAEARPRRLGEGVVGAVAQRREGLLVDDYPDSPYALPYVVDPPTAVVAEPLLYRDRLLGVLLVNNRRTQQRFTVHDQEILRLFADHAAIAIENARLFAELSASYASLQAAQDELVRTEKLRALGQMSAGIAHDLNNVLASILGQVELLKLRGQTLEVQEGLDTLETAATDGAQVVRRLQDFARQRATSPLGPMDLRQAVQDALAITRPRWQDEVQQRGRTILVREMLDGLPPIQGHAPEVREALINVIFNAVDAMPAGGTLTFTGAADPTGVTLRMTDTGIGMPEAVRQKIFEPFFTTKGVQGTGLGLSVVYGIMERHGGRIDVLSAPGQGTTIALHFHAATAEVAVSPASARFYPIPRRLLFIDDEPLVRATTGNLLRAAGHTVLEAEGGAAGLALLAEHPVDCVLTDLGMPEMTGWEVARAVKALHPTLPVILLTGWGDHAAGEASARTHVDRVLGKPIRLEELLRTIAALVLPPAAEDEREAIQPLDATA